MVLSTIFALITGLVTMIAGLPYVAKAFSYYFLSPKIAVHQATDPADGFVVFNGSDSIMIVNVDYHIPNKEAGRALGSNYQLKSFGPTRMPSESIWAFTPETDGVPTEMVEITVRPKVRLQDVCRFFPSFWGSVELKPETRRFDIAE